MSFLSARKLTIGELFLSVAAGLMLFLLPNDAKNQTNDLALAQGGVFISSLAVSAALLFGIKRYEVLGTAMMSCSVITAASFLISIVNGIVTKGYGFWPQLTEYQLATMFITWVVPFFFAVSIRLLRNGLGDTNDSRMRFSHFLVWAIRAMILLYLLVIVFRHLLPFRPHMSEERTLDFVLFHRISECLDGTHENGTAYLFWHGLLLAPLTFSLLVLNPKIKWWHLSVISLAVGFTLEVLQFSFNTGAVCTDDLLLYVLGGWMGMLGKYFIDLVRSAITTGQDPHMLSFRYTPVKSNRTKIA